MQPENNLNQNFDQQPLTTPEQSQATQPTFQPPTQPTVPQLKPRKKKLPWFLAALGVALISAAVLVYLFVLKVDPATLYREALVNSISQNDDIRGTFEVESDNVKFDGKFGSSPKALHSKIAGTITAEEGESSTSIIEIMGLQQKDKIESYLNFRSIGAANVEDQILADVYKPIVGKWAKFSGTSSDVKSPSFEDHSFLAALDILGVFTGFGAIDQKEQQAYVSALDQFKPFAVDKKVEKAKFKGQDARKLKVTINKETFKKFDEAAAKGINNKDVYQEFEDDFIDDFFGNNSDLTADVYLDTKKSIVVGVELNLKLKDEITDSYSSTPIKDIKATVSLQPGKETEIKAPESFISEEEFRRLLEEAASGSLEVLDQTANEI